MRRPIPFRVKIAIAGLAGLGLAWLIPKGGGAPEPGPTPTGTDRPGVTAVEVLLDQIPQGVSARTAGDIRVFLVRTGDQVIGLTVRSTAPAGGRVWWCPRNSSFQDEAGNVRYDMEGRPLVGSAPGSLFRVRVLVSAGRVTIFPSPTMPGPAPPPASGSVDRLPAPCTPAERVG